MPVRAAAAKIHRVKAPLNSPRLVLSGGRFRDFLDRRREKLVHPLVNLKVRYGDLSRVKVCANGFENLLRAVFPDFRNDKACCIIFRRRARFTKFFSGPKPEQLVSPDSSLESQFFVMGVFFFESMLTLVESRHYFPHEAVAHPHLSGDFHNSNISRKRHA
jgi:hypothetical protein